MSAETLREAIALMHEDPDPRWHSVADWLDYEHANLSTYNAKTERAQRTFAVARAYLGKTA